MSSWFILNLNATSARKTFTQIAAKFSQCKLFTQAPTNFKKPHKTYYSSKK